MNKRAFLKGVAVAGLGMPLSHSALAEWVGRFGAKPAAALADQEDFWAGVRGGYRLTPDYINLENGYYNIQPEEILEAFIKHVRAVNYEGAHYMRTVQADNKKRVAGKLATLAGCPAEELIITRNTTESLDMIIGGYPWKEGDEAIMAGQDYGAMLQMFRQAEQQHGMVCKVISVPNHPSSDEEIVEVYANPGRG